MKRYIEVIGESSYTQTIKEYVLDINLSVRAVKSETALDEVMALRNRCIETLFSSGLKHSELKEGGAQIWQSWYSRKQPGQEAYQIFDNQRYKLTLDMRRPIFGDNNEDKDKARREAIQNAYSHAAILAKESNLQISGTIYIEEVRSETESSDVSDLENWLNQQNSWYIIGAFVSNLLRRL
jgi:uncharacterized protein YggE